jgi:hypothetical protein
MTRTGAEAAARLSARAAGSARDYYRRQREYPYPPPPNKSTRTTTRSRVDIDINGLLSR